MDNQEDMSPYYKALEAAHNAKDTESAKQMSQYIASRLNTGAPPTTQQRQAMPSTMPAQIYAQGSPEAQQAAQSAPAPTPEAPAQPYTPQFPDQAQRERISAEQHGDPARINEIVGIRQSQRYTPQQLEAAKMGVNIDAGSDVSTWRANFAATAKAHDSAVAQVIQQKFGPDTPIRMGADSKSGDVEYYDKDRGQWVQSKKSLGGQLVDAIPGATEAAASAGGAALGSVAGPAGTVIGGGVAAGIGRGAGVAFKNKLGDFIGATKDGAPVNDTIDFRDKPNAWSEGAESAGINLAGGALISGAPAGLRMMFRGKDIATANAAESVLRSYYQNRGLVDQVDQALAGSGRKLEMSVPRIAGIQGADGRVNPDAAAMVAQEPMINRFGDIGNREQVRTLNNQGVMELYWQHKVDNPYNMENVTASNWQASVHNTLDNVKNQSLGPYQAQAEKALADAQAAAQKAGTPLSQEEQAAVVRKVVVKASAASETQKDGAYAAYETEGKYLPGGGSEIRVPMGPDMENHVARMQHMAENLPLAAQRAQASRYIPKGPETDVGLAQVDDISPLDQSLKAEAAPPNTMDLATLDRTIKDMRKENLPTATDPGISKANAKSLLAAAVKTRDAFMAQPENASLQAALAKAEAEQVRHGQEFKESFLADFTRQKGYSPELSDAGLVDHILTNKNLKGAQELGNLVRGDPDANAAIMDYGYAYYIKHHAKLVRGVATVDENGHARFMRDVFPSLEPMLTEAQANQIKELGGFAKAVVDTKTAYKNAQLRWMSSDAGLVNRRLGSQTFVNYFFNPNKDLADRAFPIVQSLGDDTVKTARAGITRTLLARSRDPGTGMVSPDKLYGVFANLKDRYSKWFGAGFTNDVDTGLKLIRQINADPGALPDYTGKTALSEAMRYFVTPISKEGNILTRFAKIRQGAYAHRLEAAMYDPQQLHNLIHEIRTFRPTRAAVGAGVGVLADEDRNANR